MRLLLIVVLLTLAGCQASLGIPKPSEQGGSDVMYRHTTWHENGKKASECIVTRGAIDGKATFETVDLDDPCQIMLAGVERTQGDASITRDVVAANAELAKMRQEFIQEFGPKVGERFFDYLVGRLGLPVPE